MSLECVICMESYHFLKNLACRHSYCFKCLSHMKKPGEYFTWVIQCPLDRQETVLAANGIDGLLTKFGANVKCEDCSEDNVVSKCFWCRSCEVTVCGACAMSRHRNHDCTEWENYCIVKDCLRFLQPFKVDVKEIDRKIQTFCSQLETALKKQYDYNRECNKFFNNVERAFGKLTASAEDKQIQKPEKMLTLVSKLVSFQNSNIPMLDVQVLKVRPHSSTAPPTLMLPNIDELVQNICKSNNNSHRPIQEVSPKINNPAKSVQHTLHCLLWDGSPVKCELINVSSICIIPNGLVVFDDKGIHKFDNSLQKTIFKGWPEFPKRDALVFPSASFYHTLRNTIFVTRQINEENDYGTVREYSAENLSCIQSIDLPELNDDSDLLAPCLITGLNDGRIICLSGIEREGFIWVKTKEHFEDDDWKLAWKSKNFGAFLSLHVVMKGSDEFLYIGSQFFLYEFELTRYRTQYLRTIQLTPEIHTYILNSQNDLYYADNTCTRLRKFFTSNEAGSSNQYDIVVDNLNLRNNSKFFLLESDKVFYFINCDENILRRGKILN